MSCEIGELSGNVECEVVLAEDVVLHTGRVRSMEHGLTSKSALADAQHLKIVIAYFTKALNHQQHAVREPVP